MRLTHNELFFKGLSTACVLRLALSLFQIILQAVGSSAFYFKFQAVLLYFSSCSSCLRLIPLLPSNLYFLQTCFRKQFLRKIWPIQLAVLHFNLCRIFLSFLILCNASSFFTRTVQLTFSMTICASKFYV
jgi:hypothetical protein